MHLLERVNKTKKHKIWKFFVKKTGKCCKLKATLERNCVGALVTSWVHETNILRIKRIFQCKVEGVA